MAVELLNYIFPVFILVDLRSISTQSCFQNWSMYLPHIFLKTWSSYLLFLACIGCVRSRPVRWFVTRCVEEAVYPLRRRSTGPPLCTCAETTINWLPLVRQKTSPLSTANDRKQTEGRLRRGSYSWYIRASSIRICSCLMCWLTDY